MTFWKEVVVNADCVHEWNLIENMFNLPVK